MVPECRALAPRREMAHAEILLNTVTKKRTSPNGRLVPSRAQGFWRFEGSSAPWHGTGQTIAIVIAYDNPTIQSDLQFFHQQWGLPDPNLTVATPQGQVGHRRLRPLLPTSDLPRVDRRLRVPRAKGGYEIRGATRAAMPRNLGLDRDLQIERPRRSRRPSHGDEDGASRALHDSRRGDGLGRSP